MSDDKSSKDDTVGGLSREAYWRITRSVSDDANKQPAKQDSQLPDEKPDDYTPEI